MWILVLVLVLVLVCDCKNFFLKSGEFGVGMIWFHYLPEATNLKKWGRNNPRSFETIKLCHEVSRFGKFGEKKLFASL
jgi:hypothetical protein